LPDLRRLAYDDPQSEAACSVIAPPRMCARDGCPQSIDGMRPNAIYCSSACKTAAWKVRAGYRTQGIRNTSRTRKTGGPSGLQVSYGRAVEAVTRQLRLIGYSSDSGEDVETARMVLREALSDLQRARLDARDVCADITHAGTGSPVQ
jgi:hypothetical protein